MQLKIKSFFIKHKMSLITAVAAVLLAVVIISVSGGQPESLSFWYSSTQQGALFVCGGKTAADIIPGNGIANIRYSGGARSAAVLMSEESGYTLYTVSGEKCSRTEIHPTNQFLVSYDGSTVIYADDAENLYISDMKNQKTTLLSSSVSAFAVSPDGQSVLYRKNEDNVRKLYLYNKGRSVFVADYYTPVAVADKAAFLYVLSGDGSLCILNTDGTMKAKLCSGVQTDVFYFSDDVSAVVFSDGDYTYVSHEGKSRVRLMQGAVRPVTSAFSDVFCNTEGTGRIVNDSDLSGLFYMTANDALFFVTNTDERINIAEDVKSVVPTGTGRAVYMTAQGNIYTYDGRDSTLAVSGAEQFAVTDNGKYIYYRNQSGGLSVLSGRQAAPLVSDVADFAVTGKNKLLVVLTDGRFYAVAGKKLSEQLDENVHGVKITADAAFYFKDYNAGTGDFSLYVSDGSIKFKKATDDRINVR